MINEFAIKKNSIIFNLDADDWLLDNSVLDYISHFYKNDIFFTYGECLIWNGKKYSNKPSRFVRPFSNIPYSKKIIKESLYRIKPFQVSHPMTFKTNIFKRISEEDFKDRKGNWLKYCLDLASYLPMLEMAKGRYKVLKKPLYAYNIGSQNTNIKINPYEFVREDLIIRKKKPYEPIT